MKIVSWNVNGLRSPSMNIIKEKQNYTCIFNITKENDIPLLIHDINKNIFIS